MSDADKAARILLEAARLIHKTDTEVRAQLAMSLSRAQMRCDRDAIRLVKDALRLAGGA